MVMTTEERDYLKMRYEEDAEHARTHDILRATVTGLLMTLIAGLLAFAVEQKGEETGKQFVAGFLICAASMLGLLLNDTHEARRQMHVDKAVQARSALKKALGDQFQDPVTIEDKDGPSLRALWMWLYFLTLIVGAALMLLAEHLPPPLE